MPTKTRTKSHLSPMRFTYMWLIFFICQFWALSSMATEDAWNEVKAGEAFVILRHALAPGTGDPDNFDVSRCETQRNLSTEGIEQAQRIGEAFKANGVEDAELVSSQWCRCIDTANEMNMQRPTELQLLNSFYNDREKGPAQIQGLLQWLKDRESNQPLIMVTHQVVITALTGVYPASGEAVIFKLADNGDVNVIHELLVQ